MPWRRLALRYAWTITSREIAHAQGWTPETVNPLTIVGLIISGPVVAGTALPYLYWLLTGKGPWQRWGLSRSIIVDPFPKPGPGLLETLKSELTTRQRSTKPTGANRHLAAP